MAALDDKAKAIIDKPNLAFVATVMADGSPQVTPVWIERVDPAGPTPTASGWRPQASWSSTAPRWSTIWLP